MQAVTFAFRPARETDVEQLLSIENRCFSSDRINRRQMRYLLNRAKALQLVAENSSCGVVGYGLVFTPQLNPQQPRPARLYSLAVSPEYRGLGLGCRLLSELLQPLPQIGYRACTLEVRESDKKTQHLYKSFGFTPVKQLPTYYADGEDGLRMRLMFRAPMNDINVGGEPCPSIP